MMALPALPLAGLNICEEDVEFEEEDDEDDPVLLLNPSLEDRVPDITADESADPDIDDNIWVIERTMSCKITMAGSALERSPPLCVDGTHLEWQTFDGSLPNGAVSIYNKYVKRTDYVSKYGCHAGFYNTDMGPYCHYPHGEKAYRGSTFEILVNKDDFEILEWKEGSNGKVPDNSVKTSKGIYVGKNEYGLGKVSVKNNKFLLPWKRQEYRYKNYQVLAFNNEIDNDHISDVKYKTDEAKIIKHPPETMDKADLANKSSQEVTQTTSISKTSQVVQRWDSSFSLKLGAKATITAGIPVIGSARIEIGAETNLQFTKGTTHTESKTHTVSVTHKVPPNHSCSISMVGCKNEADIPYTARLCRTYKNGETRWTSISGTYKRVQVTGVKCEVGRYEPLSA